MSPDFCLHHRSTALKFQRCCAYIGVSQWVPAMNQVKTSLQRSDQCPHCAEDARLASLIWEAAWLSAPTPLPLASIPPIGQIWQRRRLDEVQLFRSSD